MSELRIRNWDKWQSWRKDRGTPPWIKVHRRLMHDANWVELTDAQRGHLVAIWMLAAERNGAIPASAKTIQKICHLDTEPNIQLFVDKGFIEPGAKMTPERRQDDALEIETETEIETEREKKRDGASAPAAGWHGVVIHLTPKDHSLWLKSFSHLDLNAELLPRDAWLAEQPEAVQRKWFPSTSKYLANRNMEAKAKGQVAARPPPPSRTQQACAEYLEEIANRGTNGPSRRGICGPHSEHVVGELLEPTPRSKDRFAPAYNGLHREAEDAIAADGGPERRVFGARKVPNDRRS